MPVDNKEIKKALDDFESDEFLDAKDRIKKEIHGAVSDFFKEKLDLQKDLEPTKNEPAETDTTDTDTDTGNGADNDADGDSKP